MIEEKRWHFIWFKSCRAKKKRNHLNNDSNYWLTLRNRIGLMALQSACLFVINMLGHVMLWNNGCQTSIWAPCTNSKNDNEHLDKVITSKQPSVGGRQIIADSVLIRFVNKITTPSRLCRRHHHLFQFFFLCFQMIPMPFLVFDSLFISVHFFLVRSFFSSLLLNQAWLLPGIRRKYTQHLRFMCFE